GRGLPGLDPDVSLRQPVSPRASPAARPRRQQFPAFRREPEFGRAGGPDGAAAPRAQPHFCRCRPPVLSAAAGDPQLAATCGYHRIGWRQTEYHKPRFCCFHCSSVQSLRRISSDGVCDTEADGFSSLLPNQPQALSTSAVATSKHTTLTSI